MTADEFLISADTPEPELQAELLRVRKRRSRLTRFQWAGPLVAVGFLAVGLLFGLSDHDWGFAALWLLYAVLGLATLPVAFVNIHELDAQARDISNEIDLRGIEENNLEARAQKLFQLHSFELKRYYDQALRQGRSIYYVGVGCIVLGFGVIVAAFVLVAASPKASFDEKILIAALSAVGGVLANFIGVIYLRMFSETVQAVTGFHQRLVVTHHLHFANFLVAKIDDRTLREDALATMAEALSASQHSGASDASAENHRRDGSKAAE